MWFSLGAAGLLRIKRLGQLRCGFLNHLRNLRAPWGGWVLGDIGCAAGDLSLHLRHGYLRRDSHRGLRLQKLDDLLVEGIGVAGAGGVDVSNLAGFVDQDVVGDRKSVADAGVGPKLVVKGLGHVVVVAVELVFPELLFPELDIVVIAVRGTEVDKGDGLILEAGL